MLREALDNHLNLEELRMLCFDLGMDFDDLAGENKVGRIRELILRCERQGQLPALIEIYNRMCPNHKVSL